MALSRATRGQLAGPIALIAAVHFNPPPFSPYKACQALDIHDYSAQYTYVLDVNMTSSASPSSSLSSSPPPVPSPSGTPSQAHSPGVTSTQTPTSSVSAQSPTSSPSASASSGPKTCIGNPCYNAISWRYEREGGGVELRVGAAADLFDAQLRCSVDGSSISFSASCSLASGTSIAWCAFGLSPSGLMVSHCSYHCRIANASDVEFVLPAHSQVPAETWMLQVDRATGQVVRTLCPAHRISRLSDASPCLLLCVRRSWRIA